MGINGLRNNPTYVPDSRSLPLDRRHQVFHNGTLVITKVAKKDTGLYACTAKNRQGTEATQTGTLRVIGESLWDICSVEIWGNDAWGFCAAAVPPTLNRFTVPESLRLGQRASMLCSVTDGDLPIDLRWFRDDEEVADGGGAGRAGGLSVSRIGTFESVLRIDHLRPEHNANFTCRATNEAGEASHSQMLTVKGTPTRSELQLQHQSEHQQHRHLHQMHQLY